MLLARVQGAANKLGMELRNANTTAQASEFAAAEGCLGVVIDLRFPGLDITMAVDQLRASRTSPLIIVACGPHVHEASLDAARRAGCDVVATRGKLDRDAEVILAGMATS